MRIGAVNYLNSKPLVRGLAQLVPDARLTYDLPSRLADSLAAGRLDVALVPSVEYFRAAGRQQIISDACVACRGPVLSVKLLFRVPPHAVRQVALDEGSRTSAALSKILLAELCGVKPTWVPLPIGCGAHEAEADAVLLIGDRAISQHDGAHPDSFVEAWDLGQRWCHWTGLPFVFAMWVGRQELDKLQVEQVTAALAAARDRGLRELHAIAEREGPLVGVPADLARAYFQQNLHFELGPRERAGLARFHKLCVAHNLAPINLCEQTM